MTLLETYPATEEFVPSTDVCNSLGKTAFEALAKLDNPLSPEDSNGTRYVTRVGNQTVPDQD